MSFDGATVEAAMAGDTPAIHRLLSTSRADLSRYAKRHCHSADVEDAVQDALWIISQRVSTLMAARAFATWSFSIIRRICYRLTRDQKHLREAYGPEPAFFPSQELRVAIAQALARLPEPYRQVVILKDVFGYSAEETALQIGVKLEAAKARLHRGRRLMREDLSARDTVAGTPDGLL